MSLKPLPARPRRRSARESVYLQSCKTGSYRSFVTFLLVSQHRSCVAVLVQDGGSQVACRPHRLLDCEAAYTSRVRQAGSFLWLLPPHNFHEWPRAQASKAWLQQAREPGRAYHGKGDVSGISGDAVYPRIPAADTQDDIVSQGAACEAAVSPDTALTGFRSTACCSCPN